MNIIKPNYEWQGALSKRKETKLIILHHRGGDGTAESIHEQHKKQGWSGIGYHFYIRKDGSIFSARPSDCVGAHCIGKNNVSIGICFEGNFDKETMPNIQKQKGTELIKHLKSIYKEAKIKGHSEEYKTVCPGRNFPLEELKLKNEEVKRLESANDICWELKQMIEINNTDAFVKALEEAKEKNSPLYWGYYKITNKG